jgi:hypothetical protein
MNLETHLHQCMAQLPAFKGRVPHIMTCALMTNLLDDTIQAGYSLAANVIAPMQIMHGSVRTYLETLNRALAFAGWLFAARRDLITVAQNASADGTIPQVLQVDLEMKTWSGNVHKLVPLSHRRHVRRNLDLLVFHIRTHPYEPRAGHVVRWVRAAGSAPVVLIGTVADGIKRTLLDSLENAPAHSNALHRMLCPLSSPYTLAVFAQEDAKQPQLLEAPLAAASTADGVAAIGAGISSLWRDNPLVRSRPVRTECVAVANELPAEEHTRKEKLRQVLDRVRSDRQDAQADRVVKSGAVHHVHIEASLHGGPTGKDHDIVASFDESAVNNARTREIDAMLSTPLQTTRIPDERWRTLITAERIDGALPNPPASIALQQSSVCTTIAGGKPITLY